MKDIRDVYYKSGQYDPDPRRALVWREIIRFLSPYISSNFAVVDLGAGYCDFINQVRAAKKYAIDISPELSNFADKDVIQINRGGFNFYEIPDTSIDLVHASNFLEHFADDDLEKIMREVKRILKRRGKLVLMQPNYRLQPEHYFDDHTHKKIFTDASMESFLITNGFKIVLKYPRFLPQEMKNSPSFMPHFLVPFLVYFYIHSPLKLFSGQMLFVAEKL